MTEREKMESLSIQIAANLLMAETALLGVKQVTQEDRNKVQDAYRKLISRDDFRQSIEKSRPRVDECHLIFTPHLPGDECLAWWVFPYSNWHIQPDGTRKVYSKPCVGIAHATGGIAIYFDEEGETILCGYDMQDLNPRYLQPARRTCDR